MSALTTIFIYKKERLPFDWQPPYFPFYSAFGGGVKKLFECIKANIKYIAPNTKLSCIL